MADTQNEIITVICRKSGLVEDIKSFTSSDKAEEYYVSLAKLRMGFPGLTDDSIEVDEYEAAENYVGNNEFSGYEIEMWDNNLVVG